MRIITYTHHGALVNVREDLKGKHRDYCLCYMCGRFFPEEQIKNCRIANLIFSICQGHNVVTPVWECAKFKEVET